jgi:E3 ubiquitin-protein ligase BRE1
LLRSAAAQGTLHEKEAELTKVKDELAQAVASYKGLEEALQVRSSTCLSNGILTISQATFESELNDVRTLLSKRDADIARLREHRDQQSAELHERKHKDNLKIQSCEEYKALANSRAVRYLTISKTT